MARSSSRPRIRVLEMDPDLAVRVGRETLDSARERCTAQWIPLPADPVSEPLSDPSTSDYLGLLVLQGVLLYRLTVAGRETVDLVGPGDLVQTWPSVDEYADLVIGSRWQALEPVVLAGLDRRFMRESAPWPELAIGLAARAAAHARWLALRLAVAQIPQVSSRLEIMLWQLADRFGYVDPSGIVIPLQLSHQLLGELVGARRETVSRWLGDLRSRGLVFTDPRGFRLSGTPPRLVSDRSVT